MNLTWFSQHPLGKKRRRWSDLTNEERVRNVQDPKGLPGIHQCIKTQIWVLCTLLTCHVTLTQALPSLGFGLASGIPFPLELCELESPSAGKTRLAASSSPSVSRDWVCTLNISKHLGGMGEYYDLVDGSSLNWCFSVPMPTEGKERKKKTSKTKIKHKTQAWSMPDKKKYSADGNIDYHIIGKN